MRKFINIVLNEADPIDFGKSKADRDRKALRDQLPADVKYSAAQAQKTKGEPAASVSDYLRDIVLRNIDAAFGHGVWDADDYRQLTAFLKGDAQLSMWKVETILRNYLKTVADTTGVRYSLEFPDKREAFLRDDPELAMYRLTRWGKGIKTETQSFPSRPDLLMHVIKMIDPQTSGLTPEEMTKLGEFTAGYEEHLKRQTKPLSDEDRARFPNGGPVNIYADDERTFDPDAIPDSHNIIPSLEKFLDRFKSRDDDEYRLPYLWVSYGYGGERPSINFASPHEPSRRKTFPDLRALERWVLVHKAQIQRWYDLHSHSGAQVSARLVPKIVKSLEGMIRNVLQARSSDQDVDQEKLEARLNKIYDQVDYIDNDELKNLFRSLIYDLRRPGLREHLTDYHLEWLPERVKTILGGMG